MALTKTGNAFMEKTAILDRLIRWAAPKAWEAGKAVPRAVRGAYGWTRPGLDVAGKGAVRGMSAMGRSAAKRPKLTLPVLGLGAAGAWTAKGNFKKNWMHTDPRQDLTYKAPLSERKSRTVPRPGAIKFKNPQLQRYIRSKDSDHILY